MRLLPSLDSVRRGDEYELDLVRLNFRNPEVERIFERETLQQSLKVIRLYLTAGILLYVSFGGLDLIVSKQALLGVFAIRYGFVCPASITIFF